FAAALVSDGTVRVWGINVSNVQAVPPLPATLSYTKISAGLEHVIALRSDGQIVVWGNNVFGQCAVPALPPGLQWLDIAAGGIHTLALRSDGQWVGWGSNVHGQCDVPVGSAWRYKRVIGGNRHTVGVRHDDRIEAW